MGLAYEGMEVGPEAGRVVVVTEHRGESVERPGGTVAPGLGHDVAVAGPWSDPERGRAVRRTDATPGPVALHPERRVSPAMALLAEDAEGVTRPPGPPHPPRRLRHAPNLRADVDRAPSR